MTFSKYGVPVVFIICNPFRHRETSATAYYSFISSSLISYVVLLMINFLFQVSVPD